MYIERAYPGLHVIIRWCPGHAGVKGNKIVHKLAQAMAKKNLVRHITTPPRNRSLPRGNKRMGEKSNLIPN